MPTARPTGITVVLDKIGAGEVNTVLPTELLLPADPLVEGPLTPYARNLRLADGVAKPRSGYTSFADKPASTAVTSIFSAQFDNNTVELLRGDGGAMYYLSGSTWTTLAATGTGGYWAICMARRAGGTTVANQVIFSANGDGDNVYRYYGGGAGAPVATFCSATLKGPEVILYNKGRAFYANIYDVGLGARKLTRVYHSIVGDPQNLTGTGSGYTDLDDDPYPIRNGLVIGGNICMFKGNNVGGSIVVGTPTGNVTGPYRWDTLATNHVGLLCPRLLVPITPNLVFFLGHDSFYLYDGSRGLAPVATGLARTILENINYGSLKGAFGWYRPETNEVWFGAPTGTSTYPSEFYSFNVQERRLNGGPHTFAETFASAGGYGTTGALTWDTLPSVTWDTLPYSTWDSIGANTSARVIIFGDSNGYTWKDDRSLITDNGGAVTYQYRTGAVRAAKRVRQLGGQAATRLDENDLLTLRSVTLSFVNQGSWTPTVEVSTDGGSTWTTVSDGTTAGGATGIGRTYTKNYETNITAGSFMVRYYTTNKTFVNTITMEFTYAGSVRAGE